MGWLLAYIRSDEDSPAVLLRRLFGPLELLLEVGHVVVAELELLAQVQAYAVEQAGVRLGVIKDDVVHAGDGVYRAHDALIAEIEEERVFLFLEVGEHLLEPLVLAGVAGEHAGAHGIGQAVLRRGFGVRLADFGMVREAEIVV